MAYNFCLDACQSQYILQSSAVCIFKLHAPTPHPMHSRGGTGRIRKGSSEESLELIGETGGSERWARGLNCLVAAEYRTRATYVSDQ